MEGQAVQKKEVTRLLFVDDEPNLCLTMPAILRQHGFDVAVAGTVNEALVQITTSPFDVLLSDLNIGHPGDGFTVVSAMRRTQPKCVTFILTGYPGFDSALEAIRSQVDDYLIKPASIPALVSLIEKKLRNPRTGAVEPQKRIAQVLRESTFEITQLALDEMKAHPTLGTLPITDDQRIEFVPRTLEDLAMILESPALEPIPESAVQHARIRGAKRYEQSYTAPLLAVHSRLVEQAIYTVVHKNLLFLDLSFIMFDLKRVAEVLGIQFETTLRAYLNVEKRIGLADQRP
jgi:DNA-binding response OmpR family regulator